MEGEMSHNKTTPTAGAHLLSELCVSEQLLHNGSLPLLLRDTGMIEVSSVVHHCTNLQHTQENITLSTRTDIDRVVPECSGL